MLENEESKIFFIYNACITDLVCVYYEYTWSLNSDTYYGTYVQGNILYFTYIMYGGIHNKFKQTMPFRY